MYFLTVQTDAETFVNSYSGNTLLKQVIVDTAFYVVNITKPLHEANGYAKSNWILFKAAEFDVSGFNDDYDTKIVAIGNTQTAIDISECWQRIMDSQNAIKKANKSLDKSIKQLTAIFE